MDDKQVKIELLIDLKNGIATLKAGGDEFKNFLSQANNADAILKKLTTTAEKLPSGTNAAKQGLTGMNMVIGQTGFLLSDMDMFFVNFRMGLLSVGNNISMVANSIGVAMKQAQDEGLSMGAAFKQSLSGFNLMILGVNAGMFVIQSLSRLFASNTEEVKKNTDEVKKNADALREQSRVKLNETIFDLEKEYDLLKKKRAIEEAAYASELKRKEAQAIQAGGMYIRDRDTWDKKDFVFSQQNELDEKGKLLMQAQTALAVLGYEKDVHNRINELVKERESLQDNGKSARRDFLNDEIKKTQDQLTLMQGKELTQKKSLVMTSEEYQKQMAITLEGLKQAKTVQEKYEWTKKLIELEKGHSGAYGLNANQDSDLSVNVDIDRSKLDKNFTEMLSTDDDLYKEKQAGKENEKKLRNQMIGDIRSTAKENTDKTMDQQSGLINNDLDAMDKKTTSVTQAFSRLGATMASSLSRAVMGLKSVKDLLTDIVGLIIETTIRFALDAIFSKAGIPVGSTIAAPSGGTYVGGIGRNMPQTQLIVVNVQGDSITRGRDIHTSYNKTQSILSKYY